MDVMSNLSSSRDTNAEKQSANEFSFPFKIPESAGVLDTNLVTARMTI